MMKQKKAAMEMSVGTIVVIVLAVTMLILGLVLIKSIFSSGQNIVQMTDEQLKEEINKLFSEDYKLAIYPSTRRIDIKQDELNGVGVIIKNLLPGSAGDKKFSYVVKVSDLDIKEKCGISEEEAESWITTGREEENIPITSGDSSAQKVLFNIPAGSPLCTIRYRVNVEADGDSYATDFFDVTVNAK